MIGRIGAIAENRAGTRIASGYCEESGVKVRLIKAPQGEMEGVKVDFFHVGATYELSSSLASLLICEGYAEPAEGLFGRREKSTEPLTSVAFDRRNRRNS
jgi:hypothetical protein